MLQINVHPDIGWTLSAILLNLETILPTVRGKVTGLWFNVLEYLFSYYLYSVLRHWWLGITKSTHTHTHPFNGPLSRTTRVSRYQKGETNLDFTEARDSEWQWHQLGRMQVCTSLQTDNHTNTSPLSFLQTGCPSCRPTNSVRALKATKSIWPIKTEWWGVC